MEQIKLFNGAFVRVVRYENNVEDEADWGVLIKEEDAASPIGYRIVYNGTGFDEISAFKNNENDFCDFDAEGRSFYKEEFVAEITHVYKAKSFNDAINKYNSNAPAFWERRKIVPMPKLKNGMFGLAMDIYKETVEPFVVIEDGKSIPRLIFKDSASLNERTIIFLAQAKDFSEVIPLYKGERGVHLNNIIWKKDEDLKINSYGTIYRKN